MSSIERKKFQKALEKENNYTNMCKILNFIYATIKEEEKQDLLFNELFNIYDKNEDNFLNLFHNKETKQKTNFFKKLKQKLNMNSLISNNLNYATTTR